MKRTVRLLGIPDLRQGSLDSLCGYYAAAMLLLSLRPEFLDNFEAVHPVGDPLFGMWHRNKSKALSIAANWLSSGHDLEEIAKILNKLTQPKTSFVYSDKKNVSVRQIMRDIDFGLPVILGWESEELGNHSLLIVGYETYDDNESAVWLKAHDPAQWQTILEWKQIEKYCVRREIIFCSEQKGHRPDKIITIRDEKAQTLQYRWDRRSGKWDCLD